IQLDIDTRIEKIQTIGGEIYIDGKKYEIYRNTPVTFHKNGRVKTCIWGTSQSINVQDQDLLPKYGEAVSFNENSQLIEFTAGNSGRFQKSTGEWIYFNKDDKVFLQ
ncbi:MAG: hypothetical protein KDD50_04230, partial [Bdellovibrionales bacterium]|nr:hypothetical protein [Bdellovibrionales bacterium]